MFKPKVNKKSKQINRDSKVEDSLIEKGKEYQVKQRQRYKQKLKEETKYTFQPNLDRKIVTNTSKGKIKPQVSDYSLQDDVSSDEIDK